MDSIKAKVIRAPQRTGYKTVTKDDVPGGANQAYSSETTDKLKIIVPKGAIITAVPAMISTAWIGPSTATWGSGYVANSFDSEGNSLNSGNAALTAYTATFDVKTKGVRGAGDHTASQAPGLGAKASYVVTESGEHEYAVHASLSYGSAGAATSGTLVWWVEYMFDPNIVWEQESLV